MRPVKVLPSLTRAPDEVIHHGDTEDGDCRSAVRPSTRFACSGRGSLRFAATSGPHPEQATAGSASKDARSSNLGVRCVSVVNFLLAWTGFRPTFRGRR